MQSAVSPSQDRVASATRGSAPQSVAVAGLEARTNSRSEIFWSLLYFISFAVILTFLVRGYGYYTTPYSARPHLAEYAALRPAGTTGLMFGIVGSAMMTLMLVYSVRKRAIGAARWGSLRQWLNLHIYLGIMGPLLIVLHTSFKVQGLVAVSFWSMVGVALSGFFGRYLYQRIPRSIHGTQLSLEELKDQNEEIGRRLRAEFGLPEETMKRLDQINAAPPEKMGPFRLLVSMIRMDLEMAVSTRRWHAEFVRELNLPEERFTELMQLTRARLKLRRRGLILTEARRVFHHWHVIHKPFAIVMYVIMVVHITVALWTGYAWRL
jgi:hypothetical protein